jgi:hypothetical protein
MKALSRMSVLALVVAAAALSAPGSALASAPSATTFSADSTGATTATFSGFVGAGGESTSYHFDYADNSSTYCTSGGSSGTPTSTPTHMTSSDAFVSGDVTGLTTGTTYCVQLVASNSSGTADGGFVTFTAGAPSAFTEEAVPTSAGTANVTGAVNPAGSTTTYHVDYDLASSTWCTSGGTSGSPAHSTSNATLGFSNNTFHGVAVSLSGLTGGTQYCAQLVATNAAGSAQGGQVMFTSGAPSAFTFDAFSTGATTATVDGQVNPAGQTTTYHIDYDVGSSTWCTSGGTSGSPANSTSNATLGFTDANFHDVSVNLTALTAGTGYCAELVATNGSATARVGQVTFTAGVPDANTFEAFPTGASTATVDGRVNPAGQSTTYHVDYDVTSSTWCTSGGTSGSPANSTSNATLGFTDSTFHDVSVNLTGLTGGTQYCAQLVATNSSGSGQGGQVTFTAGAPSAFTFDGFSTGASTATVDGVVNPSGQTTTYHVDYDVSSSSWCTSGGTSGSPANSTSNATLGFTDSTFHDVSVNLTALTAGTHYCAQLVASNGSATARGGQVTFTAGAPSAFTFDAFPTGASTATVDGQVNPAGQTTTYHVDYDVSSSTWCTSGGTSGSPANSTSDATLGFTDSTFHFVSVNLTALTAGTHYCAQLVASNGSASARGRQVTFTAGAPSAFTFDGFSTGASTATVDGVVNPSGQTTTYHVDYDVSSSTWCTSGGTSGSPANSTSDATLGFTDSTFHGVSVNLSGLTGGTQYCAQLVATNGSATARGGQVTFTAGAPHADTFDGFSTGAHTATVDGEVNPSGQTTTYHVDYDVSSSTWCTSGGTSGSPANSTSNATLGFTDSTFHDVSVNLTGLTTGTQYCAELVASNASGSARGGQVTFTAGAPAVITDDAVPTGATTATVDGRVNPSGQSTTYHVDYDLSSSVWCLSGGNSGSAANSTSNNTLGFTDSAYHSVFVSLTGLTNGSHYCAQLVATNASGTTGGGQVTFTAAVTTGPPTATTGTATSLTTTGATLNGSVNPGGQATTYQFDYDLSSSTWCTSGGSSGSPANGTAATSVGFTDNTSHTVSATISGLAANTSYCFRADASNASGSAFGSQATFTTTVETHTFTVSTAGSGSGSITSTPAGISCPGSCSHAFAAGTSVSLTATPAAGSTFTGWGGACSGTGSCSVTMSADQSVTGMFTTVTVATHTLTVSVAGESGSGSVVSTPAGISCPGTCSHAFTSGAAVSLTATPAAGSTFTGWGGACSGTGSCTVTMSADQSVTATFTATFSPPPRPKCTLRPESSKVLLKARKGTKATVGTLLLKVKCNQNASVKLTGKLTETLGKKRQTFSLRAVRASVKRGVTRVLTEKLPAAALHALAGHANESIKFTLRASNANGASITTASISRLRGI